MQEIFRGRLLDADKANAKTVLYFGRNAPDLVSMGRTWETRVWPEGGRVPTRAAHAFESAVWEQIGGGPNIIIGSLLPEFAGMHATLIGDALLALRVSDESWDATSPKTRELYRRVARSVADSLNLTGYSVPHPLGGRKPITVFAGTKVEADVAMLEVRDYLTTLPSWRLGDVENLSARADAQRDTDEKLENEVESIRSEVTRLKQEFAQAKSDMLTANWREDSRRDLSDPVERAESERKQQMLTTAIEDMRVAYRDRIKSELARWRKLRPVYKEVESLLDSPDDIIRFAHKGIVF
jgi:DNA-directed RNA polymerase subunit L